MRKFGEKNQAKRFNHPMRSIYSSKISFTIFNILD